MSPALRALNRQSALIAAHAEETARHRRLALTFGRLALYWTARAIDDEPKAAESARIAARLAWHHASRA